jgi:hypothetical protein
MLSFSLTVARNAEFTNSQANTLLVALYISVLQAAPSP